MMRKLNSFVFVLMVCFLCLNCNIAFADDISLLDQNQDSQTFDLSTNDGQDQDLSKDKDEIQKDDELKSSEITQDTIDENNSDIKKEEENKEQTNEPNLSDENVDNEVIKNGWIYESGRYAYYSNGNKVLGWLVTDMAPGGMWIGLQRYYIGDDGYLLNAGCYRLNQGGKLSWFYVRPEGFVVRGCYDNGYGRVYVADNDGRLAEAGSVMDSDGGGWLVTAAYSSELQRYYIDGRDHAARTAIFEVEGNLYFGQGGVGYVLRNTWLNWEGNRYWIDNDGILHLDKNGWSYESGKYVFYSGGNKAKGWIVTDKMPNGIYAGLQRYFIGDDGYLLNAGCYRLNQGGKLSWFYVRPEGFVVRGCYDNGYGRVYVADNDGRLAEAGSVMDSDGGGWLVTAAYSSELQRYYIDGRDHAARTAIFEVEGNLYFGQGGVGYVLRNTWLNWEGNRYRIDNDGVLIRDGWAIESGNYVYYSNDNKIKGWLVVDLAPNGVSTGLQRYYIGDDTYLLPQGCYKLSQGNVTSWFYVRPERYVVRGCYDTGGGRVYVADNDGRLAEAEFAVDSDGGGWLVTDRYAGGFQRYYIDGRDHAARTSEFEVEGKLYYGQGGVGYVLRNVMRQGPGIVYWCDNDGMNSYFCNNCSNNSGVNLRIAYVWQSLGFYGDKAWRAFDWVAHSFRYREMNVYPSGDYVDAYAMEMLDAGSGNCYRFASLYTLLVKAAGYSASAVQGQVVYRNGGVAPHGWVEIYTNEGVRICDLSMANSSSRYNWYWITYETAPCNYRKF